MPYIRGVTLFPLSPTDLRLAQQVPFRDLPNARLLQFDESVSDYFFEFEPQQDIERFLQHAHFADIVGGRLIACREDLLAVAAIQAELLPAALLTVHVGSRLPAPLRFNPVRDAWTAISQGDEYRGRVTVCSCGIAGCFSQYVWVRDSVCIALFTISGACLTEVAWRPFVLAVRAEAGAAADRPRE
jgi:hypothetical protein